MIVSPEKHQILLIHAASNSSYWIFRLITTTESTVTLKLSTISTQLRSKHTQRARQWLLMCSAGKRVLAVGSLDRNGCGSSNSIPGCGSLYNWLGFPLRQCCHQNNCALCRYMSTLGNNCFERVCAINGESCASSIISNVNSTKLPQNFNIGAHALSIINRKAGQISMDLRLTPLGQVANLFEISVGHHGKWKVKVLGLN